MSSSAGSGNDNGNGNGGSGQQIALVEPTHEELADAFHRERMKPAAVAEEFHLDMSEDEVIELLKEENVWLGGANGTGPTQKELLDLIYEEGHSKSSLADHLDTSVAVVDALLDRKKVPYLEPVPPAVREHIKQWYEDHKATYTKVWSRLDEIRGRWGALDRDGKVALLKLAYINSVLSIRTPVHIHEAAFDAIVAGQSIEDAMRQAGAGMIGQRAPAMKATLADAELWDDVVDHLDAGQVDAAHHRLQSDAAYLGAAKAPFTLANLGFTQKMCVDGNVARLFRARQPGSRIDPADYEKICQSVRDMFPDLSRDLPPYQLQWLLFDWQRFFRSNAEGGPAAERTRTGMAVAQHNVWFETALGDIDRVIRRMETLTAEAEMADFDNGDVRRRAEAQRAAAEMDDEIERAVAASVDDEDVIRQLRGDPSVDAEMMAAVEDDISTAIETAINGD